MRLQNINTSEKLNNLQRIFLTTRKKTNEILSKYDDVDYVNNPSVDVYTIANDLGIQVIRVLPEDINFEHAVLDDTDKENILIKVNNKDNELEQRFSIAHELEHYFKKKAEIQKKVAMLEKTDVFKDSDLTKKTAVIGKTDLLKKSNEIEDLAARTGNNYKKAAKIVEKCKEANAVAQFVANVASFNLGIDVHKKKVYIEIAKLLLKQKPNIQSDKFIYTITNTLYDEEIADYFAANILVPYERFIHWEKKSNSVIAKAFKVPVTCIKKRRKEIKSEKDFISSKYKYLQRVTEER